MAEKILQQWQRSPLKTEFQRLGDKWLTIFTNPEGFEGLENVKITTSTYGAIPVTQLGEKVASSILFQKAILESPEAKAYLEKKQLESVVALTQRLFQSQVVVDLIDMELTEVMKKFDESLLSSGKTKETDLGMFVEKSWLGVVGSEHAFSGPDVLGLFEAKLHKTVKGKDDTLIRALEFTGEDFIVEEMTKKGGTVIKSVKSSQINNPVFQITASMQRLIEKMASLIYFGLGKSDSGGPSIKALFLFTELWLENAVKLLMESIPGGVRINAQSKEAFEVQGPGSGPWIGKQTFDVFIRTENIFGTEGDTSKGISTLTQLYLLHLDIYNEVIGNDEWRAKIYSTLRDSTLMFSIAPSLVNDLPLPGAKHASKNK